MKQHEFRDPNTRCLSCASPEPRDVSRSTELDHTKLSCPKCDDVLLSRITATGSEASYPHHLWVPHALLSAVDENIPAHRAAQVDLYWTGAGWSIAINGRHVRGDQRITEFAKHLESL